MSSPVRLGVIGYGYRARHMAQLMCRQPEPARLAAIADPQWQTIRQKLADDGLLDESTQFYATADEMLSDAALDGVIIGTRCSLHAAMALKIMERGLAVFLEKPIATTLRDLQALAAVGSERVVVSFPLRLSALVQLAADIIQSGRIGTVEHVQAVCDVPYGSVYYQTWYRDENETRGMFLQKASHDFDYINYLLAPQGIAPVQVSAMTSKQVFRGNHPAGLLCMNCPEKLTCHESPYHPDRIAPLSVNEPAPEMCAFAVDTGNEDSGSALIQYSSGMHVSYSQNFYSRGKSAKRGARLIGYKGTIEFDWFTNTLHVFHHLKASQQVETHTFEPNEDHGGGDVKLARNFVEVCRGEQASVSPLSEGLLNGLMCLQARESAITRRFQEIDLSLLRTPEPISEIVPERMALDELALPASRSNGFADDKVRA